MKCISLTQPWASLVILGHKGVETRSWRTKHRGPLLIHASRKFPAEAQALCNVEPFRTALQGAAPSSLPLGQVLGSVLLLDCVPTNDFLLDSAPPLPGDESRPRLTRKELAFGDYSPGRFGWLLEQPTPLVVPLTWKGHLNLFEVPDEVLKGRLP